MNLTEEQVEDFKEAFELFDKDRDGIITLEELGVVMQSLGRKLTTEELKAMIAEVDDEGFGRVQFPQFLKLVATKLQEVDSQEEMREAFTVFDRDKSGSVTANELKHVMNSLGEQVSTEEVEAMIREADADGDGKLSFEDFLQFIQQKGLTTAR
eukprot:CAMPEP_0204590260 /NCGR_PEP_ID=MMETSP0661-20131031/49688_1 /ASSEMBLY_ACC=CAM_ASM_000606 /TAXON_ID=109239 /ORGANISM="Alexandrium margalefi, Strain AMGDE01CS-322" /LENGTH=153 /DNA_ID=CAMNT_0051600275 /DNA_START=45 /DNA_END=506 /DNA_ORIENTATION=-